MLKRFGLILLAILVAGAFFGCSDTDPVGHLKPPAPPPDLDPVLVIDNMPNNPWASISKTVVGGKLEALEVIFEKSYDISEYTKIVFTFENDETD